VQNMHLDRCRRSALTSERRDGGARNCARPSTVWQRLRNHRDAIISAEPLDEFIGDGIGVRVELHGGREAFGCRAETAPQGLTAALLSEPGATLIGNTNRTPGRQALIESSLLGLSRGLDA
jgi:hypothetical protein